jgi:5-methylcytosine-specific restriction protein B
MNYWHIQLHPDDNASFDDSRIRELLKQKEVIGLGDWDKGEEIKLIFFNRMAIGDIVAVKNGKKPIALVEVCGDAYVEKQLNKHLDWFPNRRKVKVLEYYNDSFGFSIPQPRGTLQICDNLNTSTSQVIINWHHQFQRKHLMDNIRLTDTRKLELNTLWKQFNATFSENDRIKIQKDIDNTQLKWNEYRTKIINGKLTIDDYTNRLPNDYICKFLEWDSKHLYGSSKPGNASNFMVKLNSDGETYTYQPELKKGDKENHNTRERAIELYATEIKPLLESIIRATEALDKVAIIESSSYVAKQVLHKMAAIENKGDFLFMYSDDAVDALHKEFVDSDETRKLGKSYEVRTVANEVLGVDKNDAVESILLYRFLWEYSTTKGIADEDSPNVILYGPPGTGKTYAVKKSLDFLCQGDRSRYEFVQFHPSFTYEDFIEGIKPKGVSMDGNIEFELVDGIFKRFCKRAKANPEKSYYFVADEINRANLSSVFGEALLCLEKDYRHDTNNAPDNNLIKTQYSTLITEMIKKDKDNESLAYHLIEDTDSGEINAYFGVPKNLFFIGMMNDVDKSIDTFDLALRRRFKWIRKDCDLEVIREETTYRNGQEFKNIGTYVGAADKLNKYISEDLGLGKSYEFGHSFYMKMTDIASRTLISKKNVQHLFDLHLRPTLKEYLRSMYPETELDKVLAEALDKFTAPFN